MDFGGESGRVLVVEDHSALREVLARTCRGLGCTVETAANGAEALRRLDDFHPDLVVLDLNMPVMGGAEFAARYRCRADTHARIVVLTADAEETLLAQTIRADAWIPKEDPELFIRAVLSFIGAPALD